MRLFVVSLHQQTRIDMKNQIIELNGFKYRVYNVTENMIHCIKQNAKGDLTANKANLLNLTSAHLITIAKCS